MKEQKLVCGDRSRLWEKANRTREAYKKLITAAPELLDALETLLSECERVDYKPTQPLRFLSYNPAVITKAFNAIKNAKDKGNEQK